MNSLKYLIPTMLLFCILDFIWLSVVGKSLYFSQLGSFLSIENGQLKPNFPAAAVVYVLFAMMIWLIVLPLAKNQIPQSFLYGALLGFIVYGIYDMTNLAVLKDWPLTISLIDWCWGITICCISSGFCAWLKVYFEK